MNKVILGIDPGLGTSGFGVLKKDGSRALLVDYGALILSPKCTLVERVGQFSVFFEEKITQHGVTDIALETPFLGRNVQSFLKLGYARGIIYHLVYRYKLNMREYAPSQVKQALTGHGSASKEQVARVVKQLFPMLNAPAKLDITDAIAVMLCSFWQQN